MTELMLNPTRAITKGSLYLPSPTYSIRNNCQVGMWMKSDGETPITNSLSFNLLHCELFYGDLGKTKATNWLQIWGISDQVLNGIVIWCSYIKGRSLNLLGNTILENAINEQTPADTIFHSKFLKQTNEYGTHYILGFETETMALNDPKRVMVANFLASSPIFSDTNIPPTIFPVRDMSADDCKMMLQHIRDELRS